MINVDKESIRKEIEERQYELNIQEQWFTPAGNERSAPMYEALIKNDYLGKTKRIKKRSVEEVKITGVEQFSKWNEQEIRKRVKDAKNDAKEKAEAEWIEKRENLNEYLNELGNILQSTVDWDDLLDHSEYHEFKFDKVEPPIPAKPNKPNPPKKTFIDSILPFLWNKKNDEYNSQIERLEAHSKKLSNKFLKDVELWKQQKAEGYKHWAAKKKVFNEAREKRNQTILQFKENFEAGKSKAVLEYFETVFENSIYPEGLDLEYSLNYEVETKTLLIDLSLPSQDDLPKESDYKLKKQRQKLRL